MCGHKPTELIVKIVPLTLIHTYIVKIIIPHAPHHKQYLHINQGNSLSIL